ncbi:S8 family peptidase [Nonomuraea aridisoli]|uniref:Peptidase S8 and S53 subtilisin kexin sedolisin n=1 Tax=Nonomuraea aridisoli TaxID=2070368 RepID=A0A2W2FBM4_9ACTN|nr:S8/S53 family peptidase [Nonomuraea aridisoli]PZG22258.1 peptidase S8 and S53 subtilisin kexin sedolisin [Nonomuraea aridisoli]
MELESVGASFIRTGQVLIDRSAMSAAARWTQAVSEADGVCVVHLAAGADPCEVTAELRDQGLRASPNHVLRGQPLFFGGPASRPFPAEPVPFKRRRSASGVVIGLLDTGVAKHPWWSGSEWYARLAPEQADATEGSQAGHGTFIAGLLARAAPGAELRVERVLDGDGLTDEATVVRALHRMRQRPPHVLNLSFGCHSFDDRPPPLLTDAIRALDDTVTVACAGNTGSDQPFWPAALPYVVGVAAVDATLGRRAPYSAHGTWVDACAPGDWLTSSYLDTADFGGYATWSGTSFATALVTAAIADGAAEAPAREVAERLLEARDAEQIADLGVLVRGNL